MSTDTFDSMLRGVTATPSLRPPPRIGQKLGGRYVIEALIGQGGMGTVFRALDEKLGETVALKVMTGALDEQVLRDEVRIAQKVTHANVCRTFDLEEVDGYHLVKMELVAGETLAARLLREPKLPIDTCIRVARAIASGLSAAHERKIVHGDLKPANVMLDGERVVLMDFGIARLAADPTDGVRGTVGYMAPELVRDGKADERADIYALGCVLYEMLAGERVFSAPSRAAVAARHAAEPAPDVRARRPDTPRWLARSVARMLAKRPEGRSAGLAQLVAGPRHRTRWIVSGTLLASAFAIGVRAMATPRPWVPAVHDFETFEENGDGMSLSPDAHWIAFSSDRREHEAMDGYVMSVRTGEVTPLIANADDLVWARDGASILYKRGTHVFRQPIEGAPPRARGPAEDLGVGDPLDDCGDALLIRIAGLSLGRVVLRFPDGRTSDVYVRKQAGFITDAHCDPSGQHIVVVAGASFGGGHNDVYLADRRGNLSSVTSDHKTGTSAIFTADGNRLVASRVGGDDKLQLFEMDLHGGHLRRLLDDDGPDMPCQVSRDGRLLLFVRDDSAFFPVIVSATGTQPLTRKHGVFWFVQEVRPGLVVAAKNGIVGSEVVTIAADSGKVSVLARGGAPFASLDGKTIYFRGEEDHDLLSIPAGGGTPVRVASLPGRIILGDAGPDGIHVSIDPGDGAVAGYVIVGGSMRAEGVNGLVSVAPSGGWSAVTAFDNRFLDEGAELSLVPPGAALDHPTKHFHVTSIHNRWVDDHRLGYCLRDHCEVLDVASGKVTPLPLAEQGGVLASVMRDGVHVLDSTFDDRITRHIITNFDQR